MSRSNITLIALASMILLLIGCTSGGSPVTTDLQDVRESTQFENPPILLGLYDIELDGENGVAQVVPLRGPAFQVNIVQYLQPPLGNPANLGVGINQAGTDILAGIFDLDISITHPFPGSNLRGFDVRGILLGEKATEISQYDYDVQYPKPTETHLLNPDGYTRWWNAVEFLTPGLFGYTPTAMGNASPKGTINGYKYFTDDLASDAVLDIDTDNRGTFSTQLPGGDPNTLTRQFIIKFPVVGGAPKVKFRYAILASFASPYPATVPPGEVDDYPPEANCPEPYQISVAFDPTNTAYFTSTGSGGDLVLNVEIFDWQAPDNPEGVPGELGNVIIESPTLFDDYIDFMANATLMPSSGTHSSVWQIEIEDVTPTSDSQDILIIAQSADPTSYAPLVPGSGIYPGGAVLSAYCLKTLSMPGNSPPTIGTIQGPAKYAPGASLSYTLSDAEDLQDGSNLTIRWDFDGDLDFNDDEDGSDTNFTGEYTFAGPGDYTAQCRVYDTAMAYSDSNVIVVTELDSLPYYDPMDGTTESLWTVENGLFDTHSATLEWSVQGEFWGSGDPASTGYENNMDTTLISPMLPIDSDADVNLKVNHRWETESYSDDCKILYRKNGGGWTDITSFFYGSSTGYPDFIEESFTISGLQPGDYIEIGFAWNSDGSITYYDGWDITNIEVTDNSPPEIEGIYGPTSVDSLGPHTYTTVATDIDGIGDYTWSMTASGEPPVYDIPGQAGVGDVDITFPADGNYDIWVKVTDLGDPVLSETEGPYTVTVFVSNPDAFWSDDFDTDTGDWTYTGGTGDGAYQDFWHIDTVESWLSNVGPDGYYAEHTETPTEKTASVDVTFPDNASETRFRILHSLGTDSGGGATPYDGQWVTIDGTVIDPDYGFMYEDNGGLWDHGYFVGYTDAYETSTFIIGTAYNDGSPHTLTFHSLSNDTISNNQDGWQIDYAEFWQE